MWTFSAASNPGPSRDKTASPSGSKCTAAASEPIPPSLWPDGEFGVRLAGCVGRDSFAEYVLESLKKGGVNTDWVQRTAETASTTTTGFFYINVTPDGERTFFGSRAANGCVRDSAELKLSARVRPLRTSSATTSSRPAQLAPQRKSRGKFTLAEAGFRSTSAWSPASKSRGKFCKSSAAWIFCFSVADEATLLTGERDTRRSFARLRKAGAREVVLKVGKPRLLDFSENGGPVLVPSF